MISMKMRSMAAFVILLVLTGSICAQNSSASNEETSQAAGLAQAVAAGGSPIADESIEEEIPWDYDPYKVLVWYVTDDNRVSLASLEPAIRAYLARDFESVWRLDFAVAPPSVATAAKRGLSDLTYDQLTASDPVLAVKRDHPDAVRIRVAKNVGEFVDSVYLTEGRAEEVLRRAAEVANDDFNGIKGKFKAVVGDESIVRDLWNQSALQQSGDNEADDEKSAPSNAAVDDSESVSAESNNEKGIEAILVSRGIASTLSPEAKLIVPEIADLVGQTVEKYDKVFIVSVKTSQVPNRIEAIEFDTLMRHFGPVASVNSTGASFLPRGIGICLTKAFGPMVRIENAGQRSALGLLRAGGLVKEKDRDHSPAWIRVGDILEPMTRKNDRNGNPIMIGALDWAYLHVTELDGYQERNVQMDFYSGRGGGLQGRKNKRTFKTALRVRPELSSTDVRLHLQRDPDFPLIGYELYQKDLESGDMTFVGRTNWDGVLRVEATDDPLRLLYVKNGGAILARLPLVPGLYHNVVADLSGDDIRLQAEAYIRGAQNSIIDLVAIRELFKARILLRLERGEMEKAEELLTALRDQPTSDALYGAIGKKQQDFINLLGTKNANQSRKVDEMFTNTRELLQKHITPKLVQDLELAYIEAQENGGKLPPREKKPKVDNSADGQSTEGAPDEPSASQDSSSS